MTDSNNKRVAKNAIALTLRMILVSIVGLFTSRIVIQALGIDDYGIYGVAGGVVDVAAFLNISMAAATSRFITFDIGTGNFDNLKKTFSAAFVIHLIIAGVVAIFAETVGLWFVNNKMNFPEGSMLAVNVLYQINVLFMIINFTQVPYSAEIIAHEKMDIFAYFEIGKVLMRLGGVFSLFLINNNRLIWYGILMLFISILSATFYRLYCIKHFPEARIRFPIDKSILKKLFAFSGFGLYGNMGMTVKIQGMPIILNIFFGVVANAAASIAYAVIGIIKGFTEAILQAFKPQIIKAYAVDNIVNMQQLMRRSVQFALLAFGCIAIPVFLMTDDLLFIWLGQVPTYSVEFLRLIIIAVFFDLIVSVNNAGIHATGNIFKISIISGTLYLLTPLVSWGLLKYFVHNATVIYIVNVFLYFSLAVVSWFFVKKQIPRFQIGGYILGIFMSIISCAASLAIVGILMRFMQFSKISELTGMLIQVTICSVITLLILTSITALLAFNRDERQFLMGTVRQKFSKVFSIH